MNELIKQPASQSGQKTWVILGSAPNPTILRSQIADSALVCVNASGCVASQCQLPIPELTIMSGYMAAPPKNKIEKTTRNAIKGLKTKELVWINRGCTFAEAQTRLKKLKYSYETAVVFTHEQRAQIVKQITGADLATQSRDRKISTGLFAVCFALYRGASEVILSGISLSTGGYEYAQQQKERKHVLSDQTAIAKLLDANLPIKTSEKALSAATGLPLVV